MFSLFLEDLNPTRSAHAHPTSAILASNFRPERSTSKRARYTYLHPPIKGLHSIPETFLYQAGFRRHLPESRNGVHTNGCTITVTCNGTKRHFARSDRKKRETHLLVRSPRDCPAKPYYCIDPTADSRPYALMLSSPSPDTNDHDHESRLVRQCRNHVRNITQIMRQFSAWVRSRRRAASNARRALSAGC